MSSTKKADIMEIIQKIKITVRAEDLLNPLYVAKELESSHSQPKYIKVVLFFTTDINIGILTESSPIH